MDKQVETCPGMNWIGGEWVTGESDAWQRRSPGAGEVTWDGNFASLEQAQQAIEAAREAFPTWAEMKLDERIAVCRKFEAILKERKEELSRLIAVEMGKPVWEARTEVAASIAKVESSIDALMKRRWTSTQELGDFMAVTRFRPHGVMFVIGPFNFPSHVPGGHIIPALLAGNTLIFKPSEQVPATGQWLAAAWEEAGLPGGVLNLIHGSGEVASRIANHDEVDGVLFTGSAKVGTILHRQLAGQPHKVLALEMGGNNPLVVHGCSDLRGAAITTILSAFLTSGQRCTCTRRLIVSGKQAYEDIVQHLSELIPQITIGLPLDEVQPFMGPLIHPQAAKQMLTAQQAMLESDVQSVVPLVADDRSDALLRPGLLTVAKPTGLDDCEHFGPLLFAMQAEDLDHAIELANQTQFGLSAGFLGDEVSDFHHFLHRTRAGVINWNRQTTGASGKLPFGGVGMSGNHQPSGYFAADYCSYPIASLESHELADAKKPVPGLPFMEG